MMLQVFTALAISAKAHSQAACFRRQQIQEKLILQHIATWQFCSSIGRKRYALGPKRLSSIDVRKAVVPDSNKQYIGSLKNVNLRIMNHAMVTEIITLQAKVTKAPKHFYRQVQDNGGATS
jgi:hypothetical protein